MRSPILFRAHQNAGFVLAGRAFSAGRSLRSCHVHANSLSLSARTPRPVSTRRPTFSTTRYIHNTAARSEFTVPLFINGEEIRSGGDVFPVTSPATGQKIHSYRSAGVSDALKAVDAAQAAFKTWSKTTPIERRDLLLKAAEIVERRKEELAQYNCEETSCPNDFITFDIGLVIGFLKDAAGRIATMNGLIPTPMDPGRAAVVLKEPYGVVLAMSPWNAPWILGTRATISPLAVGNTVVFKAPELSPRCLWELISCFHEAGIPRGVINMIVSHPSAAADVTSALIAAPAVKKINFTGSTAVGRIVAKTAGEHLKPVLLELGGQAPAIVWEDADLDLAALKCAIGKVMNHGQICMSTERVIIHSSVADEFAKKLVAVIDKVFPNEVTLINEKIVKKNLALIDDAVSKGASVLRDAGSSAGTRMRPTVLKNVTPAMDIYDFETFAPSLSLIEVNSEEEAIRVANDTAYGLNASVFTRDLRRGLRIAKELECGSVHVNDMTVHDEAGLMHGGAKASGFGRFNAQGLEEWVRMKTITYDK